MFPFLDGSFYLFVNLFSGIRLGPTFFNTNLLSLLEDMLRLGMISLTSKGPGTKELDLFSLKTPTLASAGDGSQGSGS